MKIHLPLLISRMITTGYVKLKDKITLFQTGCVSAIRVMTNSHRLLLANVILENFQSQLRNLSVRTRDSEVTSSRLKHA